MSSTLIDWSSQEPSNLSNGNPHLLLCSLNQSGGSLPSLSLVDHRIVLEMVRRDVVRKIVTEFAKELVGRLCRSGCWSELPDRFNGGLEQRKAIPQSRDSYRARHVSSKKIRTVAFSKALERPGQSFLSRFELRQYDKSRISCRSRVRCLAVFKRGVMQPDADTNGQQRANSAHPSGPKFSTHPSSPQRRHMDGHYLNSLEIAHG